MISSMSIYVSEGQYDSFLSFGLSSLVLGLPDFIEIQAV